MRMLCHGWKDWRQAHACVRMPSDGGFTASMSTQASTWHPNGLVWLHPLRNAASKLIGLLVLLLLSGCAAEGPYPQRPILLVCPWAVGGGTDRVSRQVAVFLEQELNVPVNVINATGGAGVTGHSRGIRARPDGYTLTMMTVEINMFRHQALATASWDDFTPVMLLNRDSTALFVRTDAPWNSLAELTEAVRSNPGQLTASGTAAGGIWHLGMAGWLGRIGLGSDAIKWVPADGAYPALQDLASGGLDLVCCSLPEARILLENGNVRSLGVMAEERVAQFPEVATFKEQGVDWSMGAWRGIGLPRGVNAEIVETLTAALERIATGETVAAGKRFPEFMENEGFNIALLGPEGFHDFLNRTDRELGKLLTSPELAELNEGTMQPMGFPVLLFAALGVVLGGLAVQRMARSAPEPRAAVAGISSRGIIRFVEVVVAVMVYLALAERLGFVITAGGLLVLLFWRLGTRPATSVAISLVLTPAVYQLFAGVLRVPLPRGLLGW